MAGEARTYWCQRAAIRARDGSDTWQKGVRFTVLQGQIERIEIAVPRASVDRTHGLVIPGMPNLHSHAFQRALVGRVEQASTGDDSFWTWREGMYELATQMDPTRMEAIAAQLYVECLEAGYTAVGEFHYLHQFPHQTKMAQALERAAVQTGMDLTLLPVFYERGGFAQPLSSRQRRFRVGDVSAFEDWILELDSTLSVRRGLAFHSLRAVDLESLHALLSASPGAGPFHIHISEQPAEVEACLRTYGRTPVALLAHTVELGPQWCLVHATHATEEELAMIAASKAVVGLCPTTEANLGDGCFALSSFLGGGGAFGVGSDSQVTVDPCEELRWLEYQARLASKRRNCLPSRSGPAHLGDLWFRGQEGGSRALGLAPGLVEGGPASWVELDEQHPRLLGLSPDQAVAAWLLGARALKSTVVLGEQVVLDGRHRCRAPVHNRFEKALPR